MPIKVIIEELEQIKVIRIQGRIDTASAPVLEKKIQNVSENADRILVDFSKVDYLSSSGMRIVLSASKRLKTRGGKFLFFGITAEVMEIIKVAGFDRILSIFPDEAAALKSLKEEL